MYVRKSQIPRGMHSSIICGIGKNLLEELTPHLWEPFHLAPSAARLPCPDDEFGTARTSNLPSAVNLHT